MTLKMFTEQEWRRFVASMPTVLTLKGARKLEALRAELRRVRKERDLWKAQAVGTEKEWMEIGKYKSMAVEAVRHAQEMERVAQTWREKWDADLRSKLRTMSPTARKKLLGELEAEDGAT